jgi:elongation factor 1 alpha-like protein
MRGQLVPAYPARSHPRLLGGSSKLAKLAEERKKKAAAAQAAPETPNGALSSLDRLSKPKVAKENITPVPKSEPRKYPVRPKREPTPPPKEPSPEPEEPQQELPSLRASPTAFGKTLSTSPSSGATVDDGALHDLFRSSTGDDAFKGPSPDDTVLRAQQNSKSLNK